MILKRGRVPRLALGLDRHLGPRSPLDIETSSLGSNPARTSRGSYELIDVPNGSKFWKELAWVSIRQLFAVVIVALRGAVVAKPFWIVSG